MVTTEWTLEHDGHFEHDRVGAWTIGTSRYRRWSPRGHRGHRRRAQKESEMSIMHWFDPCPRFTPLSPRNFSNDLPHLWGVSSRLCFLGATGYDL